MFKVYGWFVGDARYVCRCEHTTRDPKVPENCNKMQQVQKMGQVRIPHSYIIILSGTFYSNISKYGPV